MKERDGGWRKKWKTKWSRQSKKSAFPNLERWLAKLSTTQSPHSHNRTLDFVKSCSLILDFQSVLISAQPCGDANVFSSSSYPLTRKSKSVKTDRINNKIPMLNSYELHSDWQNSSAYHLLLKVFCCVCLRLPGFRGVQLESLHILTARTHQTFANVLGKALYRSAGKPESWTRKAYSTTYEPDSNFADDNMTSITRKANSRFSKQDTLSIDIEIRKDANLD
jgi:hypothetical protein